MTTIPRVYEDEDLTPSQRADLAQHTLSALRLALGQAGWTQVRPDRWEEPPHEGRAGAVVETTYCYGETRAKMWASRHSPEPMASFSFIGRSKDHAVMDRFKKMIGAKP